MLDNAWRAQLRDFSPQGWGRVIATTLIGTVLAISVCLFVDSFNFMRMEGPQRLQAIISDIVLPLMIGSLPLYFLMSKLRELAIAHKELSILASTDSLTSVLNRGAFTTLVDAYLNQVKAAQAQPEGALLLIDADHFKSINDAFGHDRGDEALKIMAVAIKSSLRSVDLIGRLGGEEFGVFLPGSSAAQAEGVAERIRHSVSEAEFTPDGRTHPLSVSVGGIAFSRKVPYGDLYRLADREMYEAKQNGRNRIEMAHMVATMNGTQARVTLH